MARQHQPVLYDTRIGDFFERGHQGVGRERMQYSSWAVSSQIKSAFSNLYELQQRWERLRLQPFMNSAASFHLHKVTLLLLL